MANRQRLAPQDMIEKLRDVAGDLGLDDDETSDYVHKGMKRAGYRAVPSYVDDDNDDGDDDDDLMPSRSRSGSRRNGRNADDGKGRHRSRSNPDDANSSW